MNQSNSNSASLKNIKKSLHSSLTGNDSQSTNAHDADVPNQESSASAENATSTAATLQVEQINDNVRPPFLVAMCVPSSFFI